MQMQSMNSTMPKRNRTVPPKECRNHAPLFSQNNRCLVKPVSRWQNKKYPEVLRLQDTFLVRVVIQNFLKKPVISTVFKADE
jgi:hypothetical protein